MGRPRLTKGLPPYVSEFRDRHGKLRVRFRRKGCKAHYFQNQPGTDAFWQEYLACKAQSLAVGVDRVAPGTFDDLISQYYRSTPWQNIKSERTKTVYRGEYERFRKKYGTRQVATMSPKNVANLMAQMGETPSAAANLLKRLRKLFDYAILLGMRADNPARPVTPPRSNGAGFHTWTEDEIAIFEARHPIGTRPHLALALLLYTGQRRSDIVTMGPQHVKEGRIRVRQLKTGKTVHIPRHPRLTAAVEACPSGQLAYLVTLLGQPFTAAGFGNWFRERCDEAGLKHCSAHGLRKACARRMAEIGLSNQLIKSITGHSGDSEVALYTREADQILMADKAMAAIIAADLANPSAGDCLTDQKTAENQG